MLYFRQLLHADVTSSKCCAQRNGMSTCELGQVPCCTSTTSAHRCVLIKIAARDATSSAATSCNSLFRQCCTYRVLASITHSADNLTNFKKPWSVWQTRQIWQPRRWNSCPGAPLASHHGLACELPCNARATHVQHTCNTTCNTSTFWPEQEWLFFEGSARHCYHTTLTLGDQGCLPLLARFQVGWLFLLKNPVGSTLFKLGSTK